jgi:bla regulator protein BlaR1
MIAPIADHLWQSTVVAAVIALVTLALRANRPQARYALWLAASLKFLLPCAALAAVGAQFGPRSPSAIVGPQLTLIVDSWDAIGQPFSRPGVAVMPVATTAAALPMMLLAV